MANRGELEKWKREVRLEQEEYSKYLGRREWDSISSGNIRELHRRLGLALFGLPTNNVSSLGYTSEQTRKINKLSYLIFKHQNVSTSECYIAFLYICGINKSQEPYRAVVFRIPCGEILKKYLFIDYDLRVYKGWHDFLCSNNLPKSLICFPRNGVYSFENSEVVLEFCETVACSVSRNVVQTLDVVGTVTAGASAIVGLTALAVPVVSPVLLGSLIGSTVSGLYQLSRSVHVLTDRSQHGQALGLGSSDARGAWLGVLSVPVGLAAGGATVAAGRFSQSGRVLSLAGQLGLKTTIATSCAVSALGVVNGVANIAQKAYNKEHITELDVFQVIASVLFFSNAVISTHQAQQIINSIPQEQQMSPSGWLMKQFQQLSKYSSDNINTRQFINYLTNDELFLAAILPATCCTLQYVGISRKMTECCINICIFIKNAIQHLRNGSLTNVEYLREFYKLSIELSKLVEDEVAYIMSEICSIFNVRSMLGIKIAGQAMIQDMNSLQQRQFAGTLKSASLVHEQNVLQQEQRGSQTGTPLVTEYRRNTVKIVAQTAAFQGCTTSQDIVQYTEFVTRFLKERVGKREAEYRKRFEVSKMFSPDLQESTFNEKCNIQGSLYMQSFQDVIKEYTSESGFMTLKMAYECEKDLNKHKAINVQVNTICREDNVVLAEFSWKGEGVDGQFTDIQYLQLAETCLERPIDRKNIQIHRSEACAIIHYCDSSLSYNMLMMVSNFCRSGSDMCTGIASLVKIRS